MKDNINKLKRNTSEILELPKDIVLDLPKITLIGNLEMSVENHKGIIEYTDEKIRISIKDGILIILGQELSIKTILDEEIKIKGKIDSIEFDSRSG